MKRQTRSEPAFCFRVGFGFVRSSQEIVGTGVVEICQLAEDVGGDVS